MDLKKMVESFEDLIGQEGETDWEEEIYEYIPIIMELKYKNLYIFKKIVQKKEKTRDHKPRTSDEDRKEGPNFVKNSDRSENRDELEFVHKIKEAPKLSSDDKEEMISTG